MTKVTANVRIQNGHTRTVRISVELPEDLTDMLEQIHAIEGVPKKDTIGKALQDLREQIREKGIGCLFEDEDGQS